MSEGISHMKPGEADQIIGSSAQLHRVSRVPVSPMRLAMMAKRPGQLLSLNFASDWQLTHAELHRILDQDKPQLVPQTWRGDVGVLVVSGSIRVATTARQQHQMTVIRVGSLLRVPQTYAKLPTRTTLTCLSGQADFALLGNNPAHYC